jgi:hypothetical protein
MDDLSKYTDAQLKEAYHRTEMDGDQVQHRAVAAEIARRDPDARRASPAI